MASGTERIVADLKAQAEHHRRELARIEAAIVALESTKPFEPPVAVAKSSRRGKRSERLGRVLTTFELYGLPRRVYEGPYRALLDRFGGRRVGVGEAVSFLRNQFGFADLTARGYIEYAKRQKAAIKAGRTIQFR